MQLRIISVIFLVFFTAYPLRGKALPTRQVLEADSSGLLINTANRKVTSLEGLWNYIIDPYETGFYNFHSIPYEQNDPRSPAAFYNNFHTNDKAALVEYDFDRSDRMHIPGDWNSQKEKLFYYEGTVWFRHSFNYTLQPGKHLFVYFGAANYQADVYLNGTKLGTHIGGFTPFNFEVTGIVKPTDNYLVVKVNNRRSKDGVPTDNTDWWNYGGITREVLLVEEPGFYIQDYSIQLQKNNKKLITGYVQLGGTLAAGGVRIQIPELKIDQPVLCDATGYGRFSIPVEGIQYWSPETPRLYTIYVKTNVQVLKDEIGFGKMVTGGKNLFLKNNQFF